MLLKSIEIIVQNTPCNNVKNAPRKCHKSETTSFSKNKITPRQTGKHQHLLTKIFFSTHSQQHQPPLIKNTTIIRKIAHGTGHYLLLFSYMINPISLWSTVLQ